MVGVNNPNSGVVVGGETEEDEGDDDDDDDDDDDEEEEEEEEEEEDEGGKECQHHQIVVSLNFGEDVHIGVHLVQSLPNQQQIRSMTSYQIMKNQIYRSNSRAARTSEPANHREKQGRVG